MLAAFAAAILALSGCGFAPRGQLSLPFESIFTQVAETSPLRGELRRALRTSRSQVVDRVDEAQAIIEVQFEAREREIVAFSGAGRPREFQLRYRVRFRVHDNRGGEFLPSNEIILRRDVTADDSNQLAKQQEEALLYRDMLSDMVQQITRRLASASRTAVGS